MENTTALFDWMLSIKNKHFHKNTIELKKRTAIRDPGETYT